MKRPPFSVAASVCLIALALAARVHAGGNPLDWVNAFRVSAGAPPVQEDGLLSRTALDWARCLAGAGSVSHRGADGMDALDRYRAHGGTEVRVGEIIGAGPRLTAIEKGWAASASHKALALAPSWTHAGFGACRTGSGGEVCVVLFCVKRVDGLRIILEESELRVSGRFTARSAAGALLLAGIDAFRPERWDPATGAFAFRLPAAGIAPYIRLGFVAPDGGFRLTNAFTLSRETGFPAEKARSSDTAKRP